MRRLWAFCVRIVLLTATGLFGFASLLLGIQFPPFGCIALLGIAWRTFRPPRQLSDAYGSAAFADRRDVDRGAMLNETGLILGRQGLLPRPTRRQALGSLVNPLVDSEQAAHDCFAAFLGQRSDGFIRVPDPVHLLTVSPAGGGKTTNTLAPNLFSYNGNCVVVDPKGELFKLTAEHRHKRFGHRIVRLDPARLYGPGDCLNPLDWIDPRQLDFIDRCRDLANMLVTRTGLEHEAHFLDSAENVIAAFTAYICATEGNPAARNLRGVRTFLASRDLYNGSLLRMQENENFYGILQQFGQSLTWHVDRELGSVMSTVQRQTNIFDSPLVAAATERSSFDPRELRTGRMTIYLIVPAQYLTVWSALQRMYLGTLLRRTTEGTATEANPVLFLIDECAHIGKMRALEEAVTLMRGMGIRLWLFFQSLDQLEKCFGESASTVLDNLATQQYFAINSYATAEAISKRMGDSTIAIVSENDNTGASVPVGGNTPHQQPGSRNWGRGSTTSEHGRALLRPDEVLRLPEHVTMVFHKNMRPILAERIRYFADPAFRQRLWRGYGTGQPRRLGFFGMVLALAMLLVSGLFAGFACSVPTPQHWPTGNRSPIERTPLDDEVDALRESVLRHRAEAEAWQGRSR